MQNDVLELPSGMAERLPCPPDIEVAGTIKLRRGRIHEVTGNAADIFTLLAVAEYGQDVIWIGLRRDIDTLCPAGLQSFIDPRRILLVQGVSRGELLWAAEQALRADGAFTVILDMPDTLSLRESRRLQLAAETGRGCGFVRLQGPPATSAAQTRWHCTAFSSDPPAWVWHCLKGKNGEAGRWRVNLAGDGYAKDTLHLAATTAA